MMKRGQKTFVEIKLEMLVSAVLLLWCVGLDLGHSSSTRASCVEYVLENECSSLVGNVAVEESEQQDFFDEYVSLNVSNVRMAPEGCRRPYLSYLCQLMFGSFSCESSSNEEQHCLEEQSCLQVSDLCSDYFPLDCSSSLSSSPSPTPSPTLDCSEEVKEQIEEVKKKPIQVETCLDGSKEEIECCPDPFIFDDNDECVVQCPQYVYGESIEQGIRISLFVLDWVCFFILVAALLPYSFMADMRYPNYILFVCFGSYICSTFLSSAAIFSGGFESFLCHGEKNYYAALDRFGNSFTSVLFFSLEAFFNSISFSHWLIFSFNLFCYSMRPHTLVFEKFIEQPVNPLIPKIVEGWCIISSVLLFIVCMTLGTKTFFFPFPILGTPYPSDEESVLIRVYQYPLAIYEILSGVFLICAIVLIMRRGRYIIHYQWRSLTVGFFWLFVFILFAISVFLPENATFPRNIPDYVECVASHPQKSPPPCQQQVYRPFFDLIYDLVFLVGVMVLLVIVYWTNASVFRWWRELILERKILEELQLGIASSFSEYESI